MGRAIDSLTIEERTQQYRERAEEALRLAEAASNENLRASYLSIACGWHALALELELSFRAAALSLPHSYPGRFQHVH